MAGRARGARAASQDPGGRAASPRPEAEAAPAVRIRRTGAWTSRRRVCRASHARPPTRATSARRSARKASRPVPIRRNPRPTGPTVGRTWSAARAPVSRALRAAAAPCRGRGRGQASPAALGPSRAPRAHRFAPRPGINRTARRAAARWSVSPGNAWPVKTALLACRRTPVTRGRSPARRERRSATTAESWSPQGRAAERTRSAAPREAV